MTMNQPLNHHVLEDFLTEIMGCKDPHVMQCYDISYKTVRATVISGKESLLSYSALTKKISRVGLSQGFIGYYLPIGIRLCVFNNEINYQIIFQYSKIIAFEELDDEMLLRIKEHLPYLRMNKRLEKIELSCNYARVKTVKAIMKNITTQLKEVCGHLEDFKMLSEVGLNTNKIVFCLEDLKDFDSFFRLNNINTEVVEVSMDSFSSSCFTKDNIIKWVSFNNGSIYSQSLSKIKKLIFTDFEYTKDLIPHYLNILKNIENHNFTFLEEVEISLFNNSLGNYKRITQITDFIINHFKDYMPRFNVTIRIGGVYKKYNKLDFYNKFPGFKLTSSKKGHQTFSKTFKISSKITTIFILEEKNIIIP